MSITAHAVPGARPTSGFAALVRTTLDTLSTWHQRVASRHELAKLDDRMLQDIGLSSADVEREVSKRFWQA